MRLINITICGFINLFYGFGMDNESIPKQKIQIFTTPQSTIQTLDMQQIQSPKIKIPEKKKPSAEQLRFRKHVKASKNLHKYTDEDTLTSNILISKRGNSFDSFFNEPDTPTTACSYAFPKRQERKSYNELIPIPEQRPVRLLSLHGGGVRGIIQMILLKQLEKLSKQPICNLFDYIGGTSIGGIIATSLTLPSDENLKMPKYSADDLLSFFLNNKNRMFQKNWFSFGGFLRSKYKNPYPLFREWYGPHTLGESIKPVLVPAYDLLTRKIDILSSTKTPSLLTAIAARATSAAPTYFPRCRLYSSNGFLNKVYVDGGLCVNNPVTALLVEAQIVNPIHERSIVVSIGTGITQDSPIISPWFPNGSVWWGRNILDLIFDGQTQFQNSQTKKISSAFPGIEYTLLNPILYKSCSALDNSSTKNTNNLISLAKEYVRKKRNKLKKLAYALSRKESDFEKPIIQRKTSDNELFSSGQLSS